VRTLPAFFAAHADALPVRVFSAVSTDVEATTAAVFGLKLIAVHAAHTGLGRHGGSRAYR